MSPSAIVPQRELLATEGIRRGPPDPQYVLPRGDWWLGLELGRHDVDRKWQGQEELLVNGLNATEVPHITWSAGVLLGRAWRSGFGLSLGAAYEGSSYAFRHLDRRVRVDSFEVTNYVVTLDTQVFTNNVDTTFLGGTEELQVNGTNRLGVLHVPIEGYWHSVHRRWSFGVRGGLSLELITGRRGYTLASDGENSLQSVDNAAPAFDDRYPAVWTAMVGADAGYTLSEHWSLWLTPTYMRGMGAMGAGDAPYALPERFSLRLRLTYSFNRLP